MATCSRGRRITPRNYCDRPGWAISLKRYWRAFTSPKRWRGDEERTAQNDYVDSIMPRNAGAIQSSRTLLICRTVFPLAPRNQLKHYRKYMCKVLLYWVAGECCNSMIGVTNVRPIETVETNQQQLLLLKIGAWCLKVIRVVKRSLTIFAYKPWNSRIISEMTFRLPRQDVFTLGRLSLFILIGWAPHDLQFRPRKELHSVSLIDDKTLINILSM